MVRRAEGQVVGWPPHGPDIQEPPLWVGRFSASWLWKASSPKLESNSAVAVPGCRPVTCFGLNGQIQVFSDRQPAMGGDSWKVRTEGTCARGGTSWSAVTSFMPLRATLPRRDARSRNKVQRGCLAGAIGTDQPQNLTAVEIETEAVHDRSLANCGNVSAATLSNSGLVCILLLQSC